MAMTSSYQLPPIGSLPLLSVTERAKVVDHLFERSEALHTLCDPILRRTTFYRYDEMIGQIRQGLESLLASSSENDIRTLDHILGSHPRLGERTVESTQSRAEQAQLASSSESPGGERLTELNALYEQTFPGLRYVVFVNGRARPEIVDNMEARIRRGDIRKEREDAIEAMCHIASDRAWKAGH
ncbi:MAG: hypothetical protein Q9163_003353 [Psora crenata]